MAKDFEPEIQPDGSARISPKQVRVHRTGEGLALLVGLPILAWVATRDRKLSTYEKVALGAIAAGTLILDGYLWTRYRRAEKRRQDAKIKAARISRRLHTARK